MLRLIICSIAVYVLYKYVKRHLPGFSLFNLKHTSHPQTPELKQCAECQIFTEKSRMIEQHGYFFCSQECYTKFQQKHK